MIYRLPLPRVSEVIHGRVGNGASGGATWGARGTAVHRYAAAIDLGRPTPAVPPEYQGYVDGYLEFLTSRTTTHWQYVEHPFRHQGLRFRGTPDRIGRCDGSPAVVDLKTGERAKWHGIQLAAYDLLVPLAVPRRRWIVYLPGDGTFALTPYDDPDDYAEFLTRLSAWHAAA
jgi:hypothetical protein